MSYYDSNSDISFIPLTADEEKNLFEAFYKNNDLAARDRLIQTHLKLVAKLALRVSGREGLKDEDAISAANFGLMKALESRCYKPSHGQRFSTYVRKYVLGQVMKALAARTRGAPYPVAEPAHAYGATVTGVFSTTDVELPFSRAYEGTEDSEIDSDEDVHRLRYDKVMELFAKLPKSEQKTLHAHYFEGLSFSDIARSRRGQPSREGIRKAHNRGIDRLRKALERVERARK
jgi:RNA polymerase sigma factor (sigma-70 family)